MDEFTLIRVAEPEFRKIYMVIDRRAFITLNGMMYPIFDIWTEKTPMGIFYFVVYKSKEGIPIG